METAADGFDPDLEAKVQKVIEKAEDGLDRLMLTPPDYKEAAKECKDARKEARKAMEEGLDEEYEERFKALAKRLDRRDARWVEPSKESKFQAEDEGADGSEDDLKVKLKVLKEGVSEDVLISMEVRGDLFDELIVAFGPGGLEFLQPAELVLELGSALFDATLIEEGLAAYHEYSDGQVEAAIIDDVEVGKKKLKLTIQVPGFSRYALGPAR